LQLGKKIYAALPIAPPPQFLPCFRRFIEGVAIRAFPDEELAAERLMTWDSMQSDWNQHQTKVRQRWGRLTEEDLRRINGKRTELVNVVAERYDIKRDQAEGQVEDFEQSDDFETEKASPGMGASTGRGTSGQTDQRGQFGQGGQSGPSGGRSSDTSREKTGKSSDDEDEALNQPRRGAQEQGRSGGMRSKP